MPGSRASANRVSGKNNVKWAWPWQEMNPPSTRLAGLYRLIASIRHRIYELKYLAELEKSQGEVFAT